MLKGGKARVTLGARWSCAPALMTIHVQTLSPELDRRWGPAALGRELHSRLGFLSGQCAAWRAS